MKYSIAEAAKRSELSTYTLRYYEKEGLLPFIDRTSAGVREFKESDFEWLNLITCLKKSGMPIKQIKVFMDFCKQGDTTLKERLEIFVAHKKAVQIKMEELDRYMKKINYKIWYYETSVEAGTEDIHKEDSCPS